LRAKRKVRHFHCFNFQFLKMSTTASTPKQKAKLAAKTVTPQAGGSLNVTMDTSMVTHEEDASLFVDVDSLQSYGVNAADLKKLKAVGICTVKGLKMVTKKKLCAIKGLSDAKVDKIKEALVKCSGDGNVFTTALEVAVKRKKLLPYCDWKPRIR